MNAINRELVEEATALLGHHRARIVTRDGKLATIYGLCECYRGYDGGAVIGVPVQPEQCFSCWCEWETR